MPGISSQLTQIAARLREEREKQKISQIDLSFKAGLSQNQINYIETGKRTPNLDTFLRICNALKISPAKIFEKDDMERKKARETVTDLVTRFM